MSDVRLGGTWSPLQKAKNDVIYAAARVALAAALRAPPVLVRRAASAVGLLSWVFWRSGRRRADRALSAALGPDAPSSRSVFLGLSSSLAATLEVLRGDTTMKLPLALTEHDEATLRAAVGLGKGVVFVTAHLGAWEAIGPSLVERGFDVATIARRSYDPRFDRIYDRLREARGVRALYRGDPGFAKSVVRTLRSGAVVGFTMDLAGRGVRTVMAPWPQGSRPTPIGPAELARRTGAPVVVGTAARGGRLRIDAITPISQESAEDLTCRLAIALGERLLAMPESWPWMHLDERENEQKSGFITAGSLPIVAARR